MGNPRSEHSAGSSQRMIAATSASSGT